MRFDLVDLQLFVAVAETRSITNGAAAGSSRAGLGQRADQGAGGRARRCAADARPPRRRADAGRRKPARSRQGRAAQCRGDARRSRGLCPAARRPPSASSPTRRGFRNICRRRWLPSWPRIPTSRSTSRNAKAPRSPAPSLTGAADLGLAAEHALPDNIERMPFSEDRLVLVAARGDELANRRQVDFSEVVERDFVGLISSIALHAHISGHAARLGARLRFRARLNSFDAIGQMVAAGIGIAVMPEVAAKRCARSMKINVIRIRDSWANRQARDLCAEFSGAAQARAATGGASAQICAALNRAKTRRRQLTSSSQGRRP